MDVKKIVPIDKKIKVNSITAFIQLIKSCFVFRGLIFALYKRDFFANYRRSLLGYAWLFVSPIVGVLSWVFLNYTGVLAPGNVGTSYPVFVLVSTSFWTLFLGSYSATADSLKSGSSLLFQVNFPHEVLIVIQLLQSLTSFFIGFSFNILICLAAGIKPTLAWLLLPLTLSPIVLLGAMAGIFTSLISAAMADFRRVIDMGMGLLFFVTPVLYAKHSPNEFLTFVIRFNPLTHLLGLNQDIVFSQSQVLFEPYLVVLGMTIFGFLFSLKLFVAFESKLIEKLV